MNFGCTVIHHHLHPVGLEAPFESHKHHFIWKTNERQRIKSAHWQLNSHSVVEHFQTVPYCTPLQRHICSDKSSVSLAVAAVAVVELLHDTKGRECETEEGACCSGKYGYDHQNFMYVQFVSKMSTFLTEGKMSQSLISITKTYVSLVMHY